MRCGGMAQNGEDSGNYQIDDAEMKPGQGQKVSRPAAPEAVHGASVKLASVAGQQCFEKWGSPFTFEA